MISYQWIVEQIDCFPEVEGFTNVVSCIHWRVNGTDGTYVATRYGAQNIPFADDENFTPYEQLTPEVVIGWAQSAMGDAGMDAVIESIEGQIAVQVSPPMVTPPLPWASPAG
ncbi:DUF7936 family protein [Sphingomonas sp. SRS2]|uniref:DUF7936 family protein n=1 Tax=Sphingomonas sp. SRS2 TaxID=133190 RepID=UPI000618468A|nr:hypothetical protein [Sphingomonas sp. SRS2]KKC24845.1 hypothetical protein WP12_16530 [Sphingomonas sp. SRS2]